MQIIRMRLADFLPVVEFWISYCLHIAQCSLFLLYVVYSVLVGDHEFSPAFFLMTFGTLRTWNIAEKDILFLEEA